MTPPLDLLQLIDSNRRLRPNTKRAYRNAVEQWLAFAGPDPAAWTATTAQAFYDQLLDSGIAVPTANNMVNGGLAFAFKRAAALHNLPNIMGAVDKARGGQTRDDERPQAQHALTPRQARDLLTACAARHADDLIAARDRAIVLIGLYTGARRTSLVDLDLRTIKDAGDYIVLDAAIKGGDRYGIPLDHHAWALTVAYRTQLHAARTLPGPLFPAMRHQLAAGTTTIAVSDHPLTTDGIYKALKRRADAAGLVNFHPHVLRHTFATWCRAAHIEDFLIEVVTGHKSNRGMVDRIYTDRSQLYAEVARRSYAAITLTLDQAQ